MFLFLRHYVIFVKASSVFYPYCYRTVCNQCVSKSFFLVVQLYRTTTVLYTVW